MSAADAADPLMSCFLVGRALDDVNVWRVDREEAVQNLLREGPRLLSLAYAILGQSKAAWWFAPLDRTTQVMSKSPGTEVVPVALKVSMGPPTEQERYAQQPAWGLYTSSKIDGITSYLVSASECVGSLGPLEMPFARYRLSVTADARVFEVDGPAAWHRLCRTYPAPTQGGLLGSLVGPSYEAVAQHWDAVHVTLGALLTAEHVLILGPEGGTALQGWDAEQTVWLNWVFDEVTRLPDLAGQIRTPIELR